MCTTYGSRSASHGCWCYCCRCRRRQQTVQFLENLHSDWKFRGKTEACFFTLISLPFSSLRGRVLNSNRSSLAAPLLGACGRGRRSLTYCNVVLAEGWPCCCPWPFSDIVRSMEHEAELRLRVVSPLERPLSCIKKWEIVNFVNCKLGVCHLHWSLAQWRVLQVFALISLPPRFPHRWAPAFGAPQPHHWAPFLYLFIFFFHGSTKQN